MSSLTIEELDAQLAEQLPARELMGYTNGLVNVDVSHIDISKNVVSVASQNGIGGILGGLAGGGSIGD